MVNNKRNQKSLYWAVAAVAVVAVSVAGILLWMPGADKNINTFQACKDASGTILESYPEQCKINGKSFTDSTQSVDKSGTNAYIGLAEQAALDKAKSENKSARIVERDGEALPVTMDYAPGRLNFYVKDGKVYRLQVE